MHHRSLFEDIKRKLASPPVFVVPEPEPPRAHNLAQLKERLRPFLPGPGEPVFDLHGFGKITGKSIAPKPEDEVLLLPKGTRTPAQKLEVLNHPRTVWKCQAAKAKKKDDTRRKKRGERDNYEASLKRNGGTIGKACKRGTHYTIDAADVDRRSESRIEYNAYVAHFKNLLGISSTTYLPPPGVQGVFRKGSEALAYDFTNAQLLPSVELTYVETSAKRVSEVACTWAGRLSYWERDFDITLRLLKGNLLKGKKGTYAAQLQCKGFLSWYKPLYKTLASTDYARAESSAPFLYFFKTFRRMSHFAIRHAVNLLQGDYQTDGTYRPILYLSYASLKSWLKEDLRLDSADELLDLYEKESDAFWLRFRKLFETVFPREWAIIEKTFLRTCEKCADRSKYPVPLSAKEIAGYFLSYLKEVKAEDGYTHDREICRARFNQLVKEVNERANNSHMTREQALYHMLPRKPRGVHGSSGC